MIVGRLRACVSPAPPLHAPRNIPLRARAHPRSRILAAIAPVMVTAADTASNDANPRATAAIPDSPASATLNLGVAKGIVKPNSSPRKPADPAAAAAAIVNGAVASSRKPPAVTTASPHNLATKTSLLSATTASPMPTPTPNLTVSQRLGVPAPVRRPLWLRRRGVGVPIGVKDPAQVPPSRRKRRWVTRDVSSFQLDIQVGEGTYGQVWSAVDKMTREHVALKRIRMERELEGFPLTATREIKILKDLKHPNIVDLKEIVMGTSETDKEMADIYMVFEYMDYDLDKILYTCKVKFTIPQVKNMARQMLDALFYCHDMGILHRDIKGANILLDKHGNVKLADLGLARIFGKRGRKYTNRVVTLWYRAPELLLGATDYGVAVDMWSIGCLIFELICGKPLFTGRDETEQMDNIWKLCGAPNNDVWPGWNQLPLAGLVRQNNYANRLWQHIRALKDVTPACVDLITSLLQLDPRRRPNAQQALDHPWFVEQPAPCSNSARRWNI